MSLDVVDIRDFYATSLGIAARRMVRRQLYALWPDVSDMTILGYGYATPYLHTFMGEAQRVCAVMPDRMGVLPWPSRAAGEQNLTVVAREDEIPLLDLSVNRIVMVHGLESTENARQLLREMWRVRSS
ncbi:MAG: methyltransferase type 11, partial [Alphaproteobacteria bacterium]|nr:methyltransferase type 11 [Alphaproteobacteria bacterium]